MSYNSNLPADTTAPAEIRENFRGLKEDKIVAAATAISADNAVKLTNARAISLTGDATGSAAFDGSADVSITVDVLSADTSAQCSGNAATATKLETARNINGVAFDGTKDITITVPTMPVGAIIAWPSSTLPGGNDEGKWLECNGQSTDGYPELAAIVGANVPNYCGYFLRGKGGNSNELGVPQSDAIRNITGSIISVTQGQPFANGAFTFAYTRDGDIGGQANECAYYNFNAANVVPVANENRPINKAVLYLIKAK